MSAPSRIKRKVALDLIRAIYEREGWKIGDRAGFNSQTARASSVYTITADVCRNRYVAVRKTGGEA